MWLQASENLFDYVRSPQEAFTRDTIPPAIRRELEDMIRKQEKDGDG